jgi:hypothetical protein
VKTVCIFIGAQAQIDTKETGGRNPLVDAAQELDILGGRSERDRERDRELDAIRGEKVADRIEDDPRFSKVAADPERGVEAANPDGSFEAMLAMMSGGTSPAIPDIGQANGEGAP